MRETWARRIAILTGSLVVLLAVLFAYHQNPIPHSSVQTPAVMPPAATGSAAARIRDGQRVYAERACARCHTIAGQGSQRSSLDGIGTRRSETEIRAWLTPTAAVPGFQARHAGVELTPAQRDALVAYLLSLR